MRIAPPAQLSVHVRRADSRSELWLRYAVAYSCTLIAIIAAQLIIPTPMALVLGLITLLGLPLSLYLRWSDLRIFGRQIPRLLINSLMMTATIAACLTYLVLEQPELFSGDFMHTMMVTAGPGDSITILMNLFLIFAAVRSLAIINDKDAVLSAVPSFSVLLLLIVVHRGPAVVAYFLVWSVIAAALFSLDHRHESRQSLSGIVPSLEPGQDIKLSARSLATTMGFSLLCAIGISFYLSSRDARDRGLVESWILGMAGRVTQLALNIPEVSIDAGPERQINFSSGPALPTRAELWKVQAINFNWEPVYPEYWRMFTLSKYDGATWSQQPGSGVTIKRQALTDQQWPRLKAPRPRTIAAPKRRRSTVLAEAKKSATKKLTPENPTVKKPAVAKIPTPKSTPVPRGPEPTRSQREGFSVTSDHPFGQRMLRSFGASQHSIIQIVQPVVPMVGFAPALPAVSAVKIRSIIPRDSNNGRRGDADKNKTRDSIRARQDGAIDIGVLQPNEFMVILSSVSPGNNYGLGTKLRGTPFRKTSPKNQNGPKLSASERKENLSLPPALLQKDSRVKQLAQAVLRSAPASDSDYARARRLAQMVQNRAVYTLRPPTVPASVDAAEYFLFESRRGYCTYFAGALTVMCRASGIPARVVSGFVNPEWVAKDQPGILREANAHAWTEVWVEGWGWTSLDATPPGNRGENAAGWWQNWQDLLATTFVSGKYWIRHHRPFVVAIVLLWGVLILILLLRRGLADPLRARLHQATQGRVGLSGDQSRRLIFKAYNRAAKKLARRFRRRVDWETPGEWLASAEQTLNLENPKPMRDLTRLFLQAEYSPRAISEAEGVAAYAALRDLSLKSRREEK